jgi:hypothetical protein
MCLMPFAASNTSASCFNRRGSKGRMAENHMISQVLFDGGLPGQNGRPPE